MLRREQSSKARQIDQRQSFELRRARPAKVCGPEWVQTLRGELLGREVVLVVCGEAHEDAIDLTRRGAIVERNLGWVAASGSDDHGFDPKSSVSTLCQRDLSLREAKSWAERQLDDLQEETVFLVWVPGVAASLFPTKLRPSASHALPAPGVERP